MMPYLSLGTSYPRLIVVYKLYLVSLDEFFKISTGSITMLQGQADISFVVQRA